MSRSLGQLIDVYTTLVRYKTVYNKSEDKCYYILNYSYYLVWSKLNNVKLNYMLFNVIVTTGHE